MKILLVGINSRFIHSNPALYYLKRYAEQYASDKIMTEKAVEIREYTINQEENSIVCDIFETGADVICFSCYIWNIGMVGKIIGILGKVMPSSDIWLGGPEVSFECSSVFDRFPSIRGVMSGEGEAVFLELCEAYLGNRQEALSKVLKAEARLDLDMVPFPYSGKSLTAHSGEEETKDNIFCGFTNRIIYYESSRGCPYGCSYCLSSVDRHVRLRSMGLVEKELQYFLDAGVLQVKFVDRTFNCNREHTRGILEYIKSHDNGVTNFHFEIAAESLDEEEMKLLSTLRPGQVQLEIGVQTVNPKTLEAINRKSDIDKLSTIVERLLSSKNMHIHLDLIAGLPYEDIVSFRHSFNRVYAMHGDNLQLGFLKLLKGSPMADSQEEYGIVCSDEPPYEILSTKWLHFSDVLELKRVEDMLEVYHNSLQFRNSLNFIEQKCGSGTGICDMYSVFLDIADFYRKNGLDRVSHSRNDRYGILREWWLSKHPEDEMILTELLLIDLYLRENVKSRPGYGREGLIDRESYRNFFEKGTYKKYLKGYEEYSSAQVSRMVHVEKTSKGYIIFDYLHKNPITKDAETIIISEI